MRRLLFATALVGAVAAIPGPPARAQAEGSTDAQVTPPAAEAPAAAKAARTKPRSRKQENRAAAAKAVAPPAVQTPAAASPTLAAAAASGAEKAALGIAGKLREVGAATCGAAVDADVAPTMVGVTQSNTVTTWSDVEPRDSHAVSVFVAQHYGGNQAVPYGVTGVIASPHPSGACDSTVVQVVTSPLPCAAVRDTLLRSGKLEGELAGIPLVRSGQDQTFLMTTATNTCVLVGFHSSFRK